MRLNYRRCRDEVEIVERQGTLAIEPYLRALVDSSGSDLHLKAGVVPRIRVDGTLHPLRGGPLSPADTEHMLSQIIRRDLVTEFDETGEADFALMIDGVGRFRVNAFRQRGDVGLVLRRVSIGAIPLQDLGLPDAVQALSLQPRGLILVTGPTGSGKTVSLYTGLNILNKEDTNISTAEDPAEINLPGVNQVNVNEKAGLTFAAALKSFLRQDPDIIMVGEIRDLETADIAIKAAQTGHLVLSTLHTNDAPTTLTRMRNMGIAPFNIASSVILITAQRLGRRLCAKCKAPVDIPRENLIDAGFDEAELDGSWTPYGPVGCPACNNGYKGRVGIYEVMPITEELQRIILRDGSALEIAEQARSEGVRSLRMSGLHKVQLGITSLDEVLAVTNE